ncbi:hypothetical protein [Agromyces silvae]|uniref:hypothetical protein n=1 Tax=Agromyces silvae TaxID=3388266 RepID=UPI00280B8C3D|nr:hypothetical protein [Agromyces protaetiae]
MAISVRRITVGSLATVGLAGALALAGASAASASGGGEVVVRDNGQACVAVWKNADGSYTDYRYQNY